MTNIEKATEFLFFLLLFCVAVAKEKECKDVLDSCEEYLRLREGLGLTKTQTCSEVWSKKYCKKTCGLCKKVVICGKSPYGCCWDNVTPRSKTGQCPVCKDIYKSFCPRFKLYCDKWSDTRDGLGARFRRSCPVTCDRCTEGETFFKRKRFLLL